MEPGRGGGGGPGAGPAAGASPAEVPSAGDLLGQRRRRGAVLPVPQPGSLSASWPVLTRPDWTRRRWRGRRRR
jgi:hypothetical protein